jgi:hypothetical protein
MGYLGDILGRQQKWKELLPSVILPESQRRSCTTASRGVSHNADSGVTAQPHVHKHSFYCTQATAPWGTVVSKGIHTPPFAWQLSSLTKHLGCVTLSYDPWQSDFLSTVTNSQGKIHVGSGFQRTQPMAGCCMARGLRWWGRMPWWQDMARESHPPHGGQGAERGRGRDLGQVHHLKTHTSEPWRRLCVNPLRKAVPS